MQSGAGPAYCFLWLTLPTFGASGPAGLPAGGAHTMPLSKEAPMLHSRPSKREDLETAVRPQLARNGRERTQRTSEGEKKRRKSAAL